MRKKHFLKRFFCVICKACARIRQRLRLTIADNFYIINFMKEAVNVIKRSVQETDRLGVAVSGGADSVCLLHILTTACGLKRENITVLNVEHGIRGEASVSDSRFVRALADDYGVNFEGISADVPAMCRVSGRSEESEAREVRRGFFKRMLDEGAVDFILTAHHADDRTEGLLMHIFRGTGLKGLYGMRESDGRFIRPLIYSHRWEIEEYNRNHGLKFVCDETNSDIRYTRNWLRREIVPRLKVRYPLDEALNALSVNASSDDAFIRGFLDFDKYIYADGGVVKLSLDAFSLHRALASRYVFEAVCRAGRQLDVEEKHIAAVLELAGRQNGKRIDIGGGLVAAKEYDGVAFYAGQKDADDCREAIPFAQGITEFGGGFVEIFSTQPRPEKGRLIADADRIPDGALIRCRSEGDVFRPFGGGTKKLKEYFIDKKIPWRKRDKLPLLCYNNTVLAVFGVEISDSVKITADTVNAVELKFTEDDRN